MKKTSAFLAALLLVSATAFAATEPVPGKKVEFSTGFAFAVQKYNYGGGYKETDIYMTTPFRLGCFLWKGLELEPELMLMLSHWKVTGPEYSDSGHSTAWILSGNLLYNIQLKKSSRWIPFVLAGYGFGNGNPEATDVDVYYGDKPKTSLLNLGAGIRYTFGNVAALRFEYRFRGGHAKYEVDLTPYKETVNYHTILLGLSLFF